MNTTNVFLHNYSPGQCTNTRWSWWWDRRACQSKGKGSLDHVRGSCSRLEVHHKYCCCWRRPPPARRLWQMGTGPLVPGTRLLFQMLKILKTLIIILYTHISVIRKYAVWGVRQDRWTMKILVLFLCLFLLTAFIFTERFLYLWDVPVDYASCLVYLLMSYCQKVFTGSHTDNSSYTFEAVRSDKN